MPKYSTTLGNGLAGIFGAVISGRAGQQEGYRQANTDAILSEQIEGNREARQSRLAKATEEATLKQYRQGVLSRNFQPEIPAVPDTLEANFDSNPTMNLLTKGAHDALLGQPKNMVEKREATPQASIDDLIPNISTTGSPGREAVPAVSNIAGAMRELLAAGDADGLKMLADARTMLNPQGGKWLGSHVVDSNGKAWGVSENGWQPLPFDVKTDRKAPTTRQVNNGGVIETQEWDPVSGSFRTIAKGYSSGSGPDKPPAGYRWSPNGGLEVIPGGPADATNKPGAPTEDERKAAGWVAQADKAYTDMLAAMAADPEASSPGIIESIPYIPEAAANFTRSPERQKFNQAASSFAEATLRAATGAGVNENEAKQKIAELTPQIGDSQAVIDQKKASMLMYLDALRLRAGRALPEDSRPPAAGGFSIRRLP